MLLPSLAYSRQSVLSASSYNSEPGIQVYSVRNQLQEDFKGTMKKVADIGYVNVEGYGLGKDGLYPGEIKPAEYRKVVEGVGMKLLSTHCSHFAPEETPMMLDFAKAAGFKYMVVGGLSVEGERTIDTYRKAAEEFNKIGEQCNAAGIKFGYHNHSVEFEQKGDQIPMEVLIEEPFIRYPSVRSEPVSGRLRCLARKIMTPFHPPIFSEIMQVVYLPESAMVSILLSVWRLNPSPLYTRSSRR